MNDITTEKKLYAYIKKAASFSFMAKASGLCLGFLLQLALARLLTTTDYGAYLFLISNSLLIIAMSLMGFDKAALKILPEFEKAQSTQAVKSYHNYAFSTSIISAIIIASIFCGVLFAFYQEKLSGLNTGIMALLIIISVLGVACSLYDGFLQSIRKPLQGQVPHQIIKPLIILSAVGVFYALDRTLDLSLLMIINVVSAAFIFMILFFLWKINKPKFNKKEDKEIALDKSAWWKLGLGFQVITLANMILTQTDILVIGSLLDEKSVAIYGVALKISSLLTFFLGTANMIVSPIIARFHMDNNKEALQKLMTSVSLVVTGLTVIVAFCIVLGSGFLLGLFGEEYLQGKSVLIILCIGSCINALTGTASYLLSLTGNQRFVMMILLGSAVGNFSLNVFMVSNYGVIGAAISTAIVTTCWNIALLVIAIRKLGVNPTFFPLRV